MRRQNQMHAFLRRAAALAAFVALLRATQIVNWTSGYGLNPAFGLIPRHVSGMGGIVAMSLLHGSFAHLVANTLPLLVMGGLLMATATRSLLAVNMMVIVLGGGLVWILGSPAIHVGASGLIFGWFGFLIARGLVDRSPVTLGAAVVIGALYGFLLWGVLSGQPGVSWEAHLFGALAGVATALLLRSPVRAPRLRSVDRP
ncbi:rhomboid family intramembrane serine protease [Sulfitobacter indolifex]|nr:rhomboid family intramembrane serine protease [Sulfitobacter indolifex]